MDNHGRIDNSDSKADAEAEDLKVEDKERYNSEGWSEICRESHRVKRGKGKLRRTRIDQSVDKAISLLAEELGVRKNEVIEHAVAALCREILEPISRGYKTCQETVALLDHSIRRLERELSLFDDISVQALVAESMAKMEVEDGQQEG